MADMDRVIELNFRSSDEEAYLLETHDWSLPHVFQEPRHTEKIEGSEVPPQGWRMKERMKTVSVALVLCLNVGVDPPGTIKLQPCARHESWVDPLSLSPQKALEQIGQNLQKQYERWQPRARYKQSLDPTVDEVKKLCVSLRRNAKEERVLFHYNGHGVPCPTTNGEIWVFNRNYTQYIPLSIYDLQTWMSYPSIYVYDCNNAGIIIKSFAQFAEQHEREYYTELRSNTTTTKPPTTTITTTTNPTTDETTTGAVINTISSTDGLPSTPPPPNYSSCIQLGACSDTQSLPMNPDLPADLFTACLTTPIKMALRWFVLQNQQNQNCGFNNKLLCDGINLDTIEKVPGQLNDRRTMLGELNWIFTAITDTIAWNILPRSLFQKLFRQDLLVASLFRNFLLAERIMRSYDCTPVSSPKLPPTSHHPMWHAWDYALDQCLTQLKAKDCNPPENFVHTPSPFFEEQLTAFEVWLGLGNEKRNPPEQLPIVLQVLLSQVHRVRALELLGKFLDLGWWAVNLALSVGIFPYVLKLLQSSAKELRPLLVFIWAKILAVDQTCQTDLVRDGSHKYFIQMLNDQTLPQEYRTMAVFVLSNIVRNYPQGQQACLQANLIATCLLTLEEEHPEPTTNPNSSCVSNLHKWVCICLALTWQDYPSARWCGVRDSAHEKIATVLENSSNPEVRAAAVFALGCFINGMERTEHSNSIDHSVVLTILSKLGDGEGSFLVREEVVVALHNFVLVFENQFVSVLERALLAQQQQQQALLLHHHHHHGGGDHYYTTTLGPSGMISPINLRRIGSSSTSSSSTTTGSSGTSSSNRMRALAAISSMNPNMTITGAEAMHYYHHQQQQYDSMRRVASSSSLSNLMNVFTPPPHGSTSTLLSNLTSSPTTSSSSITSITSSTTTTPPSTSSSIYSRVYNALLNYERDGYAGVSILAKAVLDHIRKKAFLKSSTTNPVVLTPKRSDLESSSESISRVVIPSTPTRGANSSATTTPVGTPTSINQTGGTTILSNCTPITPIVATKFINWCWSQYSKPNNGVDNHVPPTQHQQHSPDEQQLILQTPPPKSTPDPQDPLVYTRNWVYTRNASVRRDCFKRVKGFPGKIEDQVVCKNIQDGLRIGSSMSIVKFHPYENLVVVGGPGVVESGSSGSSSMSSNLDLVGAGGGSSSMIGSKPLDKSVFMVFEYDDTSTLSIPTHHHHHNASSNHHHGPQQHTTPTRLLNKTEIEHHHAHYYKSTTFSTSSSPVLNSIEWLNSHDSIVTSKSTLLATGCNDGYVRVYKPNLEDKSSSSCELVTSWGLSSNNRVSNVIMKYEMEARRLVCGYGRVGCGVGGIIGLAPSGSSSSTTGVSTCSSSGSWSNGRGGGSSCSSSGVASFGGSGGIISVWDVEAERLSREVEYPDCFVSCLDCNRCEPNIFIIGGEDGSVRLLDLRVPDSPSNLWKEFGTSGASSCSSSSSPTPSNNTTHHHHSSTLCVRLRHDRTVVAGNSNGKVRFYDLRSKNATKTIDTTLDITSIDVHPNLPYFGIGTSTSTVNIYGFHGQAAFLSNSIREGFAGFGRIGLANNCITSLAFHEFKPFVCFVDSYAHFSVYKSKK